MSTVEELRRMLEAAEARAKAAEAEVEAIKARTEAAKAQTEAIKAQTEAAKAQVREARAKMAPTSLLDYIRGVEEHLYMTLTIGTDPSTQSGHTSVEGRFYPQHFRPWTDFQATHEETFASLVASFGNEPLFRSMATLEDSGCEMSHVPSNELGLRRFIRASTEKPALSIINRYLLRTKDPSIRSVIFCDNAYGIVLEGEAAAPAANEPTQPAESIDGERPRKRKSRPPTKRRFPDRWLFATHQDGNFVRALVGEYKAAHSLPHQKLTKVMSAPPGDDFFPRITKQAARDLNSKAATPEVTANTTTTAVNAGNDRTSSEVYVASVICQAYDHMISTGVEFGYVASGDGLIFLRVPENDPNTLYYFWSVFPVDQTARLVTRAPYRTAMAYLTTLCMQAIRAPTRPYGWILARDDDVKRWPESKRPTTLVSDTTFSLRPYRRDNSEDDGDGGEGSVGSGQGLASSSRLATLRSAGARSSSRKRTRDDAGTRGDGSSSGQQTRPLRPPMGPFVFKPPTLPYCTQACLRGLCRRLPLDDRCPNVALHRAAAQDEDSRHPLTANAVRSRIVAQLAANMDKDFQCLDGYGCWGRHGVLFKLTVTGFGYTFVAKAVQAVHRHILENEQAIYGALAALQGVLIPVCLGLVDLVWPVPLQSFARVPHMLLLSYAGPDLESRQAQLPSNVDLDAEAERTVGELAAAGLHDDDIREKNLVWNAEVGRVMQIDFGLASIRGMEAATPAVFAVHEDTPADAVAAAGPDAAELDEAGPEAALRPCSPLADKRDLNAHKGKRHRSGSGKQRAKKRARNTGGLAK